jgi:hypothetical protein
MRESMVLICPTPQARMPAADWHDGQLAHGAHAGLYSEGLGRHPPASLKCRSCRKGRHAPPVHMIKLTERREITPYKWVHPEGEDR